MYMFLISSSYVIILKNIANTMKVSTQPCLMLFMIRKVWEKSFMYLTCWSCISWCYMTRVKNFVRQPSFSNINQRLDFFTISKTFVSFTKVTYSLLFCFISFLLDLPKTMLVVAIRVISVFSNIHKKNLPTMESKVKLQ